MACVVGLLDRPPLFLCDNDTCWIACRGSCVLVGRPNDRPSADTHLVMPRWAQRRWVNLFGAWLFGAWYEKFAFFAVKIFFALPPTIHSAGATRASMPGAAITPHRDAPRRDMRSLSSGLTRGPAWQVGALPATLVAVISGASACSIGSWIDSGTLPSARKRTQRRHACGRTSASFGHKRADVIVSITKKAHVSLVDGPAAAPARRSCRAYRRAAPPRRRTPCHRRSRRNHSLRPRACQCAPRAGRAPSAAAPG